MLSAWCDDLLALPEEVWSAYALSREPLRGRLDREGYRPYYDRAAACGREDGLLTIGIKDFNKRRKRRGMRVLRGKKYV